MSEGIYKLEGLLGALSAVSQWLTAEGTAEASCQVWGSASHLGGLGVRKDDTGASALA